MRSARCSAHVWAAGLGTASTPGPPLSPPRATFQRDDALVETTLQALRTDNVHVVATTVAHDPTRFDVPCKRAGGALAAARTVIRKAACVVCHGGMGITQQALAASVPVCVVPFGRDRAEVAGRVTAVGAGTQVLADALTPATLRATIHEATAMRAGAGYVAAGLAMRGAPAAADAHQSLLVPQ